MIDGLKIQMTTEELWRRLDQRIAWHEHAAKEAEAERNTSAGRPDEPRLECVREHQIREHHDQVASLTLLRDHLIPGETYCMGETDLRFGDLTPDPYRYELVPPMIAAAETGNSPVS